MMRPGLVLCTCDGKIDKAITVETVETALAQEGFVKTFPHLCLPDGVAALRRTIVENNIDRVVVAACPERLQRTRLREVCEQAGINRNHFALVDWREGCAQVHRGDRPGATAKAIDLVRMGLAAVAQARPLDGFLTRIAPRVLVLGGGIAGMTAARALAEQGIAVSLVEREGELGGQLRTAPLDEFAGAFETTRAGVMSDERIETLLRSRVLGVEGPPGKYRVEVRDTQSGLSRTVEAGAVIIATGAQAARGDSLRRWDGRKTLTLAELDLADGPRRGQAAESPRALIVILCAGSRDAETPYCSNVCCVGGLTRALRFKRENPTAHVTVLFRDLYLLGDEGNEELVREARRLGIEFVRYPAGSPPEVYEDFVQVRDRAGLIRWLGYDQVWLATAVVPQPDAGQVARQFRLDRDAAGFFIDPHLRLRPDEAGERGIYVAGSAHRPVDAETAVLQGLTAAARAARFVGRRELMRAADGASVNAELCTGCAQCVESCSFGAIQMYAPRLTGAGPADGGTLDRAAVDPFLCQACGNCAVACPSKAITLATSSDAQILGQIEAALEGCRAGEKRFLVFGCRWSGFAAMELAGARRMRYPANVRTIQLPCSARLDPLHVLYAFLNGAEKVALALCPPDECHFGEGNRFAERRMENLRALLRERGIDPGRLVVARMMADDPLVWVKLVEPAPVGMPA